MTESKKKDGTLVCPDLKERQPAINFSSSGDKVYLNKGGIYSSGWKETTVALQECAISLFLILARV